MKFANIAKASHFGGGGIALAMTERVRPLPKQKRPTAKLRGAENHAPRLAERFPRFSSPTRGAGCAKAQTERFCFQ